MNNNLVFKDIYFKKSSTKNFPGIHDSVSKFYQTLKEVLITSSPKNLPEDSKTRKNPESCYDMDSVAVLSKCDKDQKKVTKTL